MAKNVLSLHLFVWPPQTQLSQAPYGDSPTTGGLSYGDKVAAVVPDLTSPQGAKVTSEPPQDLLSPVGDGDGLQLMWAHP